MNPSEPSFGTEVRSSDLQINWFYLTACLALSLIITGAGRAPQVLGVIVAGLAGCFCCKRFIKSEQWSFLVKFADWPLDELKAVVRTAGVVLNSGGIKNFGRFLILPRGKDGLGFPGLLVLCLCIMVMLKPSSISSSHGSSENITLTEALTAKLQESLDLEKQKVFAGIHPVGTATGGKIHDVAITWKNGAKYTNFDEVKEFTVRFTLYWKSPLHEDGFTKIQVLYDNESARYTDFKVLSTNGTTNSEVMDTAGNVIGAFIVDALAN